MKKSGYNPVNMLREFLHMEAMAGVTLLIFALAAIIVANSALGHFYHHFFHQTSFVVQFGPVIIDKHIIHWVNDGLMAVFFFLVGLEIKREMLEGSLSSVRQAMLPGFAALGGMVIPGLVYFYFNRSNPEALVGWAAPTATDIAFALGVLALLGRHVPLSLKVFLLALAIFDDLGAIIIIALFYTSQLDTSNLIFATIFLSGMFILNRCNVSKGSLYLLLGLGLWFCVLKSGVHATLAGVAAAFMIPLAIKGEKRSLLRQLERDLHITVAFIIMPLFAFANAGVDLHGISLAALRDPITIGIIAGLFVGKQLGIFGAAWLTIKSGIAKMPAGATWPQIWGVSILAGIGFTMSLFIATLAFNDETALSAAKLGVIVGSFVSALIGVAVLWLSSHNNIEESDELAEKRAKTQ